MKKRFVLGILCLLIFVTVSGCGRTYVEEEDTIKVHKKVLDEKLGKWSVLKTEDKTIAHAGFGEQTEYKAWEIQFFNYLGEPIIYTLDNYKSIDFHIDRCRQTVIDQFEQEEFSKICTSDFEIILDSVGVDQPKSEKERKALYPKNIILEEAKKKFINRAMIKVQTTDINELKAVAEQYDQYTNSTMDIYAYAELGEYKKMTISYEKGKVVEISDGETIKRFE